MQQSKQRQPQGQDILIHPALQYLFFGLTSLLRATSYIVV